MSNTWLYGNKAKRKIVMLHIILKPKFCWVTTIVWSTANSSIVTSFRYAVQASASCGVRTATVDWIQSHSSNEQLSFLRNFSSSHTKTSLPHIKRPWIRAPYTKRQLFFQSDFHLLFSSMVQHVRRFYHKTPVVSIAYSVPVIFFFFRWEWP